MLEGEYGLSGCSLGVPARIGRNGILKIEEWELDEWETAKMNEAGRFVKDLCNAGGVLICQRPRPGQMPVRILPPLTRVPV